MKAKLITTDLNAGLRWHETELQSGAVECIHQISVYPFIRRQRFEGFGGAFTEAAAYCYQKLSDEKRKEFLESYFGVDGLGYTLGRVHIGSCDFALGNYSCLNSPSDDIQKDFNTERDDKYIIPFVQEAGKVAGKPIGLMLSPWSPPAFMKTNGEMNNGGSLKPEYRDLWAACMAKYAAYYSSKGCDVRLMTVQNEPAAVQTWDSCIWSGRDEGTFAYKNLAPALRSAGCGDVKVLAWDHNKDILMYRAAETFSVEGAADVIDGFAFHWYTGDHFDALKLFGERWQDKKLWFSEGCVEYSRFDGRTHVEKAEMYAHDILGNLNAGICGSFDWNLLLDSKGGPNHVGNFCEAPIMLTEDCSDFERNSEYYYIGQFSRFIRPGAVRLGASSWSGEAEITAFENTDGSRVAVMLNRTEKEQPVSVTEDGCEGYSFSLAPHSIATLSWQ